MNRIFVAQPKLAGNERRYVLDCLDTTWISSIGKYVSAFEEGFAEFCGVKHAIATNTGTSALHLALVALGLADRKSTRLNSSHIQKSRMPSSA